MNNDETKDSFQAAQLMLLVGYTILAASLILESFLMGWEKWALIPIGVGIIASWIIHVRQLLPTNVRIWFYSVLMMCSFLEDGRKGLQYDFLSRLSCLLHQCRYG